MPAAPCPMGISLTVLRVPASMTVRSGPPKDEISTSFPSGVNFSRLAPRTSAARVCVTDLLATSMMETVPSWALATQISLWSAETSNPSEPLPTFTTVSPVTTGGAHGTAWRRRHLCGSGVRRAGRWSHGTANRLFDDAHRAGANIGGDDALQVRPDVDHVSAVLAGAENPIDLLSGRIIAADGFGGFRGEPRLAAGEIQSMRAAQRSKVNRRQSLSCYEIDYGECVVSSAAVVGDVGSLAICRGDDFVRIVADGNARNRFQRDGIDNGERVSGFGEHQQRVCGRVLGVKNTESKRGDEQNAESQPEFHDWKRYLTCVRRGQRRSARIQLSLVIASPRAGERHAFCRRHRKADSSRPEARHS